MRFKLANQTNINDLFLETAAQGFIQVDLDSRVVAINSVMASMLGRCRDDLIGHSVYDLFDEENAALFREQLGKRKIGVSGSYGLTMTKANGTKTECWFYAKPTYDTRRKHTGSFAMVTDITAKRHEVAKLFDSESRYRAIFETSPVGLSFFDENGVIRSANPALLSLFESTEEQMIGVSFLDCCRNQDVKAALEKAISGEVAVFEGYYDSVTGTRRNAYMRLMYVPVKRNAGDRCSVISVVEDETERKRMDDELKAAKETAESASRSKSVFLANMSHEIRTPLNAVLGFAQLMQRQKDLTPTMKEYVDSIRRSGTHLLELITDILEMSKIEAGREKLSPIAFDLHALLDDVERMMRVRTDQKNVRINTSCGDTPVRIIADQGKVRQVLINLLGNAVKFTDAGSIGVRASAVGTSSIAIDVFDTGCGIAPSEQHAVFRSFEQTSSGLRAGGTGLGMAISRGFARLMGGDLVLVKSVEDRGSQFRFTFLYEPCRGECMSKDSAQRTVVGLGADTLLRTVMVVDDDVNNRIVLEGLLTDVGFSVVCAESGIQALALAEQSLPDAVLMDFRMPGMNGIEAAKRIRLLPGAAGIPVVLVTASVLAEDRDTALAEGIDAFVQKPFREGDIFTALAGVGRVSYLYAEETKQDAVPQTDFDPSDIPSVLRDEIRAAVEDGDMQAFQSVLERIVPVNAGAAESLRFMASRFEYQRILDALRR